MPSRLAVVSVSLVILSVVSGASGQQPTSPRAEELRREIIKVRAAITEQTNRLNQLEKELAAIDAPRVHKHQTLPPGLRFPVDIERAMMGQRSTQRPWQGLQPLNDPPKEGRTTPRPAPKK
jgi:hypothetical protein